MKIKLLGTLLIISLNSTAQSKYKVVYDYQNDVTSYYRMSNNNMVLDTIERPKFKKNSLVEIHLKNVNPFAVQVSADIKENMIHKAGGGFNFGSLLSGFGGMAGGQLKLNPQNLPEDEKVFSRGKSRGASDLQGLNDIITNVNALKSSLRADMANPNMNKEKILENLKSLAAKIDDSRLGDPNDNFYLFLTTLDRIVLEYKLKIDSEIKKMYSEVDSVANVSVSRGETASAYQSLQQTKNGLEESTGKAAADIDDIENLYKSLEASAFGVTYDYQMTADNLDMQLKFKPAEFSADGSASPSTNVKTRNIKIYSTGGFNINTSVALVMTNFGSKSNDYYISEDGMIQAEKNDYFVPSLGAMVNFYPMITESFNIGGSFGLGIPIMDEIKGMNFLIGPAIFLGSSNRVSLTGGIAFGPVTKLTNGLKVGETTNVTSLDNYKKTVYDFGYFFGMSFSIFNLN
ncbi:MAG: hypothetical protein RSF68_02515 [Myroides sp.]